MATRAIKPKREDTMLTGWQSMPERAPSLVREETSTIPRVVALAALFFVAVGAFAILAPLVKWNYLVSPVWGVFFFGLGLVGLLYHAYAEKDLQFRRIYLFLGMCLIPGGILFRILPRDGVVGAMFFPTGPVCFGLGLAFLVATLRQEEDSGIKRFLLGGIGVLGTIFALVGALLLAFAGSNHIGEACTHLTVGLLYLATFIGMQDLGSRWAYRAGVGLGVFGALAIVGGALEPFARSNFAFVPQGLLLVVAGAIYLLVSLGICSDAKLIVLTRRELTSYFYSPIAYLVILAIMLIGWLMFLFFVQDLRTSREMVEPIVRHYILSFIPVVCVLFLVPILTMRLLSEEKRSGTLEVLLTAPVNEGTIVVSKFLAALTFFMLMLLPWGLFLVALRVEGQQVFDYQPVLSFALALLCTGAGFLSVGLFFSSVTSNQIVAAVLAFVAMLGFIGIYFAQQQFRQAMPPTLNDVLVYTSFINLWINTLSGIFAPRFFLFHVSLAVFFLYLSTKVLEVRKWS